MVRPYNYAYDRPVADKQCRNHECINQAETSPLYQGYCDYHKPAMFQRREGYSHYYKPRPSNWNSIRARLIKKAVNAKESCEYCRKVLQSDQDLDLDHRDTERTWNIHHEDNLRVLHRDCHSKRTQAQAVETKQQKAIQHQAAQDAAIVASDNVRAQRRHRRR